jgi:hypothetical protein
MFHERYITELLQLLSETSIAKKKRLLSHAHSRPVVYMLDTEVSAFIHEVNLDAFTQFG